MARNRIIRTEFFCDERVGALSHAARLLFIALWVNCDDVGNGRADARILKAQAFAFDDCAVEQVESSLNEILSQRMIELYEVEGVRFFHLRNFLKHQRIDHPSKSLFPPPRALAEDSPSTQRGLGESSTKKPPKLGQSRSVESKSGQAEKCGAGAPDPETAFSLSDLDRTDFDLDRLTIEQDMELCGLWSKITEGKFDAALAFDKDDFAAFKFIVFFLFKKKPKIGTRSARAKFMGIVMDECQKRGIEYPKAWLRVTSELRESKAN